MTDPYDPTTNHHNLGRDVINARSSIDEERVASMADEGGVSGALMEIEDVGERKRLIEKQRRTTRYGNWRAVTAAFVLVGAAVFAWSWLRRAA